MALAICPPLYVLTYRVGAVDDGARATAGSGTGAGAQGRVLLRVLTVWARLLSLLLGLQLINLYKLSSNKKNRVFSYKHPDKIRSCSCTWAMLPKARKVTFNWKAAQHGHSGCGLAALSPR